jgi:hypothetical protein
MADPSEFNEFWRARHEECEEYVFACCVEIAPHLIGVISTPTASLSRKQRAANWARELRFEQEAARWSCGARLRTCPNSRAAATEKKAGQLEQAYPGISSLWRDIAS